MSYVVCIPWQVNTHLTPRPILLTRHGESRDNVRGRIGGDSVVRSVLSQAILSLPWLYSAYCFVLEILSFILLEMNSLFSILSLRLTKVLFIKEYVSNVCYNYEPELFRNRELCTCKKMDDLGNLLASLGYLELPH